MDQRRANPVMISEGQLSIWRVKFATRWSAIKGARVQPGPGALFRSQAKAEAVYPSGVWACDLGQ